jgi:hypothetical protein
MNRFQNISKNTFLLLLLLSGFVYIFLNLVSITNVTVKKVDRLSEKISVPYEGYSKKDNEEFVFSVDIKSKIPQTVKMHITADDEILSVSLNNQKLSFDNIKQRYGQKVLKDYKRGYNFILQLKWGINKLKVETKNYATGGYTFKIAQHYFYTDYIIFFLLIVLPIVILLIDFLDKNIDKIRELILSTRELSKYDFSRYYIYLPLIIIFAGIALRVLYFIVYGHSSYQHDQHFHIEFIKYFSDNWTLPLPDKALEFPQQPLYYLIMGKIFAFLSYFSISEENILMFIASISTLMMSVTMFVSYGTLKNITKNQFIINTSLAFLAFTPSFIFLSAQINNDTLNYFLASVAIYYIVKFYNDDTKNSFIFALIFSALVFMTKVSSGMISIALFSVLVYKYFKFKSDNQKHVVVLSQIKIFSLVIIFFLGLSFLRVYLPSTGEFLFVKSGVFSGQEIKNLDFSYFFSFRIFDLINEGQAYVYDRVFMPVKQSFFTWQYATMLLGEYEYKKVMQNLFLNKMVYITGLIYVIGFISFFYYIKKIPLILKIFLPILVINQLLIANFAFSFPSVCNTDFRYNSPTIIIWAVIISSGLYHLYASAKNWRKTIVYAVVLVNIVEIIWIINLLLLAKKNSIT